MKHPCLCGMTFKHLNIMMRQDTSYVLNSKDSSNHSAYRHYIGH